MTRTPPAHTLFQKKSGKPNTSLSLVVLVREAEESRRYIQDLGKRSQRISFGRLLHYLTVFVETCEEKLAIRLCFGVGRIRRTALCSKFLVEILRVLRRALFPSRCSALGSANYSESIRP
jgi:hypothetical protein